MELTPVDSPNNFPNSYRPPSINDIVHLENRQVDNNNRIGITIIRKQDHFLGWVSKDDHNRAQTGAQGRILTAKIFN
jgi:hypothetical protein